MIIPNPYDQPKLDLNRVRQMDLYEIAEKAGDAGKYYTMAEGDLQDMESMIKIHFAEAVVVEKANHVGDKPLSQVEAETRARTTKNYLAETQIISELRRRSLGWEIIYRKWKDFVQAKTMELAIERDSKKIY